MHVDFVYHIREFQYFLHNCIYFRYYATITERIKALRSTPISKREVDNPQAEAVIEAIVHAHSTPLK